MVSCWIKEQMNHVLIGLGSFNMAAVEDGTKTAENELQTTSSIPSDCKSRVYQREHETENATVADKGRQQLLVTLVDLKIGYRV